MTFSETAKSIWKTIQESQSILLHFHPSPDADSVGSALAMAQVLRGLGKSVTVIKGDSPLPDYLSFLPGFSDVVSKNYFEIKIEDFDLFLIQDISQLNRISGLQPIKFPDSLRTVLIDHHVTATPFAEINLIAPNYPATAQILFDLFSIWKVPITREVATCLLIGIYGDTGSLRYPRISKETFLAVASLIDLVPNLPDILFEMENNNSPKQLIFEGLALNSIEIIADRFALVCLSLADLVKYDLVYEDIKGLSIANRLKSVVGWEMGITLIETEPNLVRASFRTRDRHKFDVSRLAAALGGGGHPAAAGALLKMTPTAARQIVVDKLAEFYP